MVEVMLLENTELEKKLMSFILKVGFKGQKMTLKSNLLLNQNLQ